MNAFRLILISGFAWVFLSHLSAQIPAPLRGDFDDALLREWVQPEYPAAARQAKLEGEVTVEFVVEADGHVAQATVKKTTDEQFNASALAAVQRWAFVSATVEGKPAASGMQAVVEFKLAQAREKKAAGEPPLGLRVGPLPVTKPKLIATPTPDYPEELAARKLRGEVILEFTVVADGSPSGPKVLAASHAAFVDKALQALKKYRFEPAHQGPLALKSEATQGQMEFESLGVSRAELLSINQISVLEPEKYREPPRARVLPEPVYPRERLLAAENGSATVQFAVSERGVTIDVLLNETSRPEFGAALVAAVETWAFDPALLPNNDSAVSKLVVSYKFVPPTEGGVHRLMVAMQAGGPGVGGANGLDERLRPLWRVSPLYPESLRVEKPAGKAMIEFVIDQDGRARLPRVVSASQAEFGWAAAAAINQWVFAPPLRGGKPVDVKVNIPFDFAPPKD
jgi:TonB family protein